MTQDAGHNARTVASLILAIGHYLLDADDPFPAGFLNGRPVPGGLPALSGRQLSAGSGPSADHKVGR